MTTHNQPQLKFSDLTLKEKQEVVEELRAFVALIKMGLIVGVEPPESMTEPGEPVAPVMIPAPRRRRMLPA